MMIARVRSVIAAAIEDKVEWLHSRAEVLHIGLNPVHDDARSRRFLAGQLQGVGRDIDGCYFKALLSQPDRVRPGAAAKFNRPAGLHSVILQHTRQFT